MAAGERREQEAVAGSIRARAKDAGRSGRFRRRPRRSADIVIEPWMRLARVIRYEEGARAVTGARKLEVWIEGLRDADPGGFFPRVASVTAHPAGYLCARTTTGRERDGGEEVAAVAEEIAAARVERGTSTERQTDEPVRVGVSWGWRTATGSSTASPRWTWSAGGEVVAGTRRPRALGVQFTRHDALLDRLSYAKYSYRVPLPFPSPRATFGGARPGFICPAAGTPSRRSGV